MNTNYYFNVKLPYQYILVCAMILLTLGACSNEMTPEASFQKETQLQSASVADIISTANQLMTEFDSNTRSRMPRSVKSIERIGTATRATRDDPLFYIVNYENDGGYVMLSTKDKQNPLYAISSEGHLSESDTVENKGLKIFFDQATNATRNVAKLPPGIINPPSFDFHVDTVYVLNTLHKVNPRLSLTVRQWHQGAPFNKLCPSKLPVGCGAIAVGSVMSYFQYPNNYYDVDNDSTCVFNWNDITSNYRSVYTQKLLKTLGNKNLLNMIYGMDNEIKSGSDTDSIPPTFKKLGYHITNNYDSIPLQSNYDLAVDLIRGINGYTPHVLVSWSMYLNEIKQRVGHTWVIDGEYSYESIPEYRNANGKVISRGKPIKHPALLHCCWGWGGENNGYYRFDLPNGQLDNAPTIPTEENGWGTAEMDEHYGNILICAPCR